MSDKDRARDQAKAQLESICQMVKRLEHAQDCNFQHDIDESPCKLTDQEIIEGLQLYYTEGQKATDEQREEYHDEDKAREAIEEDPLSVQVRSGWYSPGEKGEAEEYEILLCTGGPACRIIGDLGAYNQPERSRLQYQDWGTPWTEYIASHEEYQALLAYAQQFYFGE